MVYPRFNLWQPSDWQNSIRRSATQHHTLSYSILEPRKLLAGDVPVVEIALDNLNSGVAVADDATGVGHIVYSAQDVHARFGDIPTDSADHFFAARVTGNQWQYNNDSRWLDFTKNDSDRIVANVNFDSDRASLVETGGDIWISANDYGGQADNGEFQILGTNMVVRDPDFPVARPENYSSLSKLNDLNSGVLTYEAIHYRLPNLAIYDDAGTPLLSWRVQILPYIGQESLYDQFHLNEPWNSPHNLSLAGQMPDIFRSDNLPSDSRTPFLAVAGEGTVFPLVSAAVGFDASNRISDGASNTLMLVEANVSRSVVWTQPQDYFFDPDNPLTGLTGVSPQGFSGVLVSGQRVTVSESVDPDELSNLMMRADGNVTTFEGVDFYSEGNTDDAIEGNIQQLAIGMLNYESNFMRFPAHAIYSDDRQPLLSWRVSILPFIEQNNLYQQFNLDEPWDSPHNLALLPLMPRIYAVPGLNEGETTILALTGEDAFFELDRRGPGFPSDGETIAFVRANDDLAVAWTKPADIVFDPADPFNGLTGVTSDGFPGANIRDGAIRTYPETISAANLVNLVSPHGNLPVDPTELPRRDDPLRENQNRLDDLRQLGLGALNYESANMHFPGQGIYSQDGELLLSWRVALLPHIGEEALYNSFNKREPWDSPHNLALLPLMPKIFGHPLLEHGKTNLQAVVGEDTVTTPAERPFVHFGSLADGASNTIMYVETSLDQAVDWTKPEDLAFDPATPRQGLDSISASGFRAVFADGQSRFVPDTVSDETVGRMLQRNDGEFVDFDFDPLPSNAAAEVRETQIQLRQIALAIYNYESANMSFPRTAILSTDGNDTPLLSWRVAILPFIEQGALYNKFHLDEPWNSPHNLSLLPLMPDVYDSLTVDDNFKTVFQGITGENTIFPGGGRRIGFGNLLDGASSTILVTEVDPEGAVEWTRPADLAFNPANPAGGFGSIRPSGNVVALADGNVSHLPNCLSDELAANLLSIADGNVIDHSLFNNSCNNGTVVPVDSSTITQPAVTGFGRAGSDSFDAHGMARPDLLGDVRFSFGEDVLVTAGALSLVNLTVPGETVDLTGLAFSYDPATFTAVWGLSALAIPVPPGFYDVQINTASVASVNAGAMLAASDGGGLGAPFSQTLMVALPGDANLDGVVTISVPNVFTRTNTGDVAIARANIGKISPTWADGDFNGDGEITLSVPNVFTRINTGDVAIARANAGMDIRPPVPAPTSTTATATVITAPAVAVETIKPLPASVPPEALTSPVTPSLTAPIAISVPAPLILTTALATISPAFDSPQPVLESSIDASLETPMLALADFLRFTPTRPDHSLSVVDTPLPIPENDYPSVARLASTPSLAERAKVRLDRQTEPATRDSATRLDRLFAIDLDDDPFNFDF